jgi:hypothetical protein
MVTTSPDLFAAAVETAAAPIAADRDARRLTRRGRPAAAVTGVLALATLPSGGPADGGQLVLAVSGGVLALVVLVQAHQTARTAATGHPA